MNDFVVPPVPPALNIANAVVTVVSLIALVAYAIFVRSRDLEDEHNARVRKLMEDFRSKSSDVFTTITSSSVIAREVVFRALYGRHVARIVLASMALSALYIGAAYFLEYRAIERSLPEGRVEKASIETRLDPANRFSRAQMARAHATREELQCTGETCAYATVSVHYDRISVAIRGEESRLLSQWERAVTESDHPREIAFLVLTEGIGIRGHRGPMWLRWLALWVTNILIDLGILALALKTVAALEEKTDPAARALAILSFALAIALSFAISIAGATYFELGVLTFYSEVLLWLPLCTLLALLSFIAACFTIYLAVEEKTPFPLLFAVMGGVVTSICLTRLREIVEHFYSLGPPRIHPPSTDNLCPWVLAAASASPGLILSLSVVTALVMHLLRKSSWLYLKVGIQNSSTVAGVMFLFPMLILNAVKTVWESLQP